MNANRSLFAVERDAVVAGKRKFLKTDFAYEGDNMYMPVQSYESEVLVRPLVKLSRALNKSFGIDDSPAYNRKSFRFNLRYLASWQSWVYSTVMFLFVLLLSLLKKLFF